jgi:hypothetical protein
MIRHSPQKQLSQTEHQTTVSERRTAQERGKLALSYGRAASLLENLIGPGGVGGS